MTQSIATMFHHGRASTRPPANQSYPTTIDDLGEDLLLEIFLRLPSIATLIRAAVTCRAWRRAVASSPSFRCRFRALHREPLLGVFTNPELCYIPVFPPFHRWVRDRDLWAATGRGDFTLTTLLDPDDFAGDVPPLWNLRDCQDGYLLLTNWHARLLATINPLSGYFPDYIYIPVTTGASNKTKFYGPCDMYLLCSDEDPLSYRIVCIFCEGNSVRAAVFSSKNWNYWCYLPWMEVEVLSPHDAGEHWLHGGTQANGFLFWPFRNRKHALMLDTTTVQFSVLELPSYFGLEALNFTVTAIPGGYPCIVYCDGFFVGEMIYELDEGGVKRWIPGRTAQFKAGDGLPQNNDGLNIMCVKDGFVYLATSKMVLSLCLETMEFEMLFPRSFCAPCFQPYVMAWPPCLLGNFRSFAVSQDGVSNA